MKKVYFVLSFSLCMGSIGMAVTLESVTHGNRAASRMHDSHLVQRQSGTAYLPPLLSVQLEGGIKAAEYFEKKATNYLHEEKYREAIDNFNQSLEINPDSFQSFWGRGVARFYISLNRLAIWDFDRSIQIDAYRPEAYWFRGLAKRMIDIGDWEEDLWKAVEMFKKDKDFDDISNYEKIINSLKQESK